MPEKPFEDDSIKGLFPQTQKLVLYIVPCESAAEKVSFEWSYHRKSNRPQTQKRGVKATFFSIIYLGVGGGGE